MKIAVLGNGPLGLEMGLDFFLEGADVRIIGRGFPASKIHTLCENLNWDIESYLREETLKHLGLSRQDIKTPQDLWKKYYLGIISFLNEKHVFFDREILRVQKRFLDPDEVIPDHTRLFDLFRVTYSLNPSGLVDNQLEENPELKEKLTEDILSSLQHSIESFEDFDLVFDTRGPYQKPFFMGPGKQPALNELKVREGGEILYNGEGFEFSEKDKCLTLVGTGKEALLTTLLLKDWLKEDGKILNIVSAENSAFKKTLSENDIPESWKKELRDFISKYMNDWRKQCENVEIEVMKWRELPAHEKTKIPQPQFPEPKLRIFEGYTVTSVDKLLDREGVFLTLEIPEWRSSEKKELITLSQDKVIVGNGFDDVEAELRDEPGYFFVNPETKKMMNAACSLTQIPLIKSEVFKYFSKA
ncbi:MAG: hypothetical protein NXH75_09540 [Halobacteriovoraceae bacterium]|nr:hypothetical protein [Halobacteriovoraceae bacterium]